MSIRIGIDISDKLIESPAPAIPPVLQSAVVEQAAPTKVVLTYDVRLNETAPDASAFSLTGKTISTVEISEYTVTLTVTVPYNIGNVITLDYTKPAVNPLKRLTGAGEVARFTSQAVTNNVTHPLILEDGNTVGRYIYNDLAHITKDGSNIVSVWGDSFGTGPNFGDGLWTTRRPEYKPNDAIYFDKSTEDALITAGGIFASGDSMAAYFVVKIPNEAGSFWLNDLGGRSMVFDNQGFAGHPCLRVYNDAAQLAMTRNVYAIVRAFKSPTQNKIKFNTAEITVTWAALGSTSVEIGGRSATGSKCSQYIKEMIFRKVDEAAGNEANIYNYLKDKYGL